MGIEGIFPIMMTVINGNLTISDSSPVTAGGTATFTCTFLPKKPDTVNRIFWSNNIPSQDLRLLPGPGTTCKVEETPASLSNYTFQHTCDTVHHRYTLSIVGVTERDIDVNNTWCCEVQHAHFLLDGYKCGHITKAMTPAPDGIWNERNATLDPTAVEVVTHPMSNGGSTHSLSGLFGMLMCFVLSLPALR